MMQLLINKHKPCKKHGFGMAEMLMIKNMVDKHPFGLNYYNSNVVVKSKY